MMSNPVEKTFERFCEKYDIAFARTERNRSSRSTLDFHLTDYNLSVEVKQFSSDRIHEQITRSGETSVMVLIGVGAVLALERLVGDLEAGEEREAKEKAA
jgi:hypothetical protein